MRHIHTFLIAAITLTFAGPLLAPEKAARSPSAPGLVAAASNSDPMKITNGFGPYVGPNG